MPSGRSDFVNRDINTDEEMLHLEYVVNNTTVHIPYESLVLVLYETVFTQVCARTTSTTPSLPNNPRQETGARLLAGSSLRFKVVPNWSDEHGYRTINCP